MEEMSVWGGELSYRLLGSLSAADDRVRIAAACADPESEDVVGFTITRKSLRALKSASDNPSLNPKSGGEARQRLRNTFGRC